MHHSSRWAAIAGALCLAIATGSIAAQPSEQPAWSANVSDEVAALVYGVPDSDDIRFLLICDNEAKSVELTVYDELPGMKVHEPITLTLSAAAASASVKGETTTDEMNGFVFGGASGIAVAPLLPVLRAAGDLVVGVGAHKLTLPAAGRAAAVESFAGACKLK